MLRIRTLAWAAFSGTVLFVPGYASAANILFVADSDGDQTIVDVLEADGHTVEVVTYDFSGGMNARLREPLDEFDAVYWSADGPGYGDLHTDTEAFENLEAYVSAGGRVFVTGYDSIASPSSPLLTAFLGGTSTEDVPDSPGPIIDEENSLTNGVVDLRGAAISDRGDMDCLTGLTDGTIAIASYESFSGLCAHVSLRTLGDGEIAYATSGGDDATWSAGSWNGLVRNFAAAADFSTGDPGSPEIEFESPRAADEGASFEVSVSMTDAEGDTFDFSWDLDDNGEFDEMPGADVYTVPAGTTDGPTSMRLGVRAIDSAGNTSIRYRSVRISNIEPRVTSDPPLNTSVGVDLRYQIVVDDPAGERDPLVFTLVRAPARVSVNDSGIVQWIPGESDVTLPGNTHSFEVLIEDGDGGSTTHAWEMSVSPNRQPTPPVPAYPIDAVAIIDDTPRLAAGNSEDLDLDQLEYFFQIDTVDTFDSKNLRESGPVSETPGYTAWEITEPLAVNQLYHWRVWASDGTIDSEIGSSAFYVVRDPALGPPDGGPPDPEADGGGLIVGVDAGFGGGDDGGGCSVSAGSSRSHVFAIAFAAAALVLVRRRRR